MKQVEHAMEVLELRAERGVSIQEPDTIKAQGPKLPAFEEGKAEWTAIFTVLKGMPEFKSGNQNYGPHI